jgi:hypothetical protein
MVAMRIVIPIIRPAFTLHDETPCVIILRIAKPAKTIPGYRLFFTKAVFTLANLYALPICRVIPLRPLASYFLAVSFVHANTISANRATIANQSIYLEPTYETIF